MEQKEVKEEWMPVVGYEGFYEVSNLGNIDSLNDYNRKQKRKRLKPNIGAKGYSYVVLSNRIKRKTIKVHRIVAMAFIPNPQGFPVINHKDENKLNNCADNLEWCTIKYNVNYGTGIERRIRKTQCPVIQLSLQGVEICRYESITDAAKETGSRKGDIVAVCRGKIDKTNGFKWMYVDKEMKEASIVFKKERKERTIKNKNRGYEKNSRHVVQLSLDGNFIKEYRSTRVAAKETGINLSYIQDFCYHRRKKTNDYIFKFKDEIV